MTAASPARIVRAFFIDEQGVFQVYEDTKGDSSARDVNVR